METKGTLNLGPLWQRIKPDGTLALYCILVTLRIALTLAPQNGYVHPDEFFQSPEVLAGDIFQFSVFRPWEFNTTFPIRSIVAPYITSGLPYIALRAVSPLFYKRFHVEPMTPYTLLVLPRLMALLVSFACDYSVYKMSLAYNQNYKPRLVTLASSYVMLVYATRNFSNGIEMALAALLLFVVTGSMSRTDEVIQQQDELDSQLKKAQSMKEKVQVRRKWNRLPYHSMVGCLPISALVVAGVFNRPTFLAFAFPPVFFWLQRAIDSQQIGFRHFHLRMLSLIPGAATAAAMFIICDSLYYGYLSPRELLSIKVTGSNLVVTPFNFFLYNMNSTNLAQHGYHPWYLHLLINMPLLFGPLGAIALISFTENVYRALTEQWIGRPRILTIFGLMGTSVVVPLVVLSIFPHQEPRFILPVLVPLVFLHGHRIQRSVVLRTMWYTLNAIGVIFYGFLHQAGVYPALTHLHPILEESATGHLTRVVFANTYMPPAFPLMLPKSGRLSFASGQWQYVPPNRVTLHDLAGASMEDIREDLTAIMRSVELDANKQELNHTTLLVIPTPRGEMFRQHFSSGLNVTLIKEIWPHVTTEFPPLGRHDPKYPRRTVYDYSSLWSYIGGILTDFQLSIYRVDRIRWGTT